MLINNNNNNNREINVELTREKRHETIWSCSSLHPLFLHEIEQKELCDMIEENEMSYIELRNDLIELWSRNINKYLSLSFVLNKYPSDYASVLTRIWDFLNQYGFINFGLYEDDGIYEKSIGGGKRKKIIIIGAGAAGLGAARKLHNLGHDVTVLEARNRIGGRVNTSYKFGTPIDLGASLITGCKGNPINVICKQLSLKLIDIDKDAPYYYYDGTKIDIDTIERMAHLWELLEECTDILSHSVQNNNNKQNKLENTDNINNTINNDHNNDENQERDEQNKKWEQHYRNLIEKMSMKISSQLNVNLFDDLINYNENDFSDNLIKQSLSTAMSIILKYTNLSLTNKEKNVLNWCQANSEYGSGTNLINPSMLHWKQDEQWNMRFGGKHKMINHGYSPIVQSLAYPTKLSLNPSINHLLSSQNLTKEEKENYKYEIPKYYNKPYNESEFLFKLYLNRPVDKIKWFTKSKDGIENNVKVYTKDGDEYHGDCCLIAVPQGVLKKNKIKFIPSLPSSKQNAINGMGFGNLNKLILKFSNKFWGDTMYFHYTKNVYNDDNNIDYKFNDNNDNINRGQCFTFWNLYKVTCSPVLVALYSGDSSYKFEEMSDDELITNTINILKTIFGDKNVPNKPLDFERTNWAKDEYAGGCYAFCEKNSENSYLEMIKPIDDVLYFAGEHCCKETPDTVGGAYSTGLRAAGYIEKIGKQWPKDLNYEKFPFVKTATILEIEREKIKPEEKPYSYQVDVQHERKDIARIYSKYEEPADAKHNNQYKKAVMDKDQVVKCNEAEMDQERKALMFGFDTSTTSTTTTTTTTNGHDLYDDQNDDDEDDDIDTVNTDNNNHNNNNNNDIISSLTLPPVLSCIEKQGDLTNEVEYIDSNDENDQNRSSKKSSSSSRKKHRHSKSSSSSSSSSSKHDSKHKSSSKHNSSKHKSSSSSRHNRSDSSIDLTSSDKKISGMSNEAKKLLKESKEKIGHFARKHLAKALANIDYDKEDFKNIAKKVTNKVFDDFRKKFKQTKSKDALNYDKFMNSKRKRKVEDLIKAYIKRDITEKK